jgi:peptidoglycan/LPS O-acetylase OafA/YrhL
VWFSVLLPVVVVAAVAMKRRLWVAGAVCFLVSSCAPLIPRDRAQEVFLYLPMFGVGVALAAYETRFRESRWFEDRPWLAGAALFACLAGITARYPLDGLATLAGAGGNVAAVASNAVMLGSAAGLLVLALANRPFARALSRGPVLWLGQRSFSLYLVHEPIVVALAFAFRLTGTPAWFVVLALVVSLSVTAAFYRLVELPTIRIAHRVASRPSVVEEPSPIGGH